MNRAALHAQLGRLKRQHRSPASAGGIGMLGPQGSLSAAANQQVYFCVRIALIADDPNENGGLDSNGYYQAFIESDYFQSMDAAGPEVRVEPDSIGAVPRLAAKGRIWAYAYSFTTGSPDSSDDGFPLMRPIVGRFQSNYDAGANNFGSAPSYAIPGPTDLFSPVTVPDDSAYFGILCASVIQNFAGSVTSAEPDAIDVAFGQTGTGSVSLSNYGPVHARVGYFAVPTYSFSAGLNTGVAWNYEDLGWQSFVACFIVDAANKGNTVGWTIGGAAVNGSGDSVKCLATMTMMPIVLDTSF